LPSCSWHYIGKRKFTSDPSVGVDFICHPMALVGPRLGDLAHMNMACPNNICEHYSNSNNSTILVLEAILEFV
jgi:hypothetical protein